MDDYDAKCKAQEKINWNYLDVFIAELEAKGLSEKTIRNHVSNVEFYLNTYLLSYDIVPMEKGCSSFEVDRFFDDFFIRKCMWSTPATIRSTAASLKKFYKCMLKHEYIPETAYKELTDTFKEHMEEWIDDCNIFNDFSGLPW